MQVAVARLMVGTTATVTGLNPGLQEAEILTILLPVLSYVGAICGVIYSLVRSPSYICLAVEYDSF
jgi:hypothetical protein